jgi:hypothetical protein
MKVLITLMVLALTALVSWGVVGLVHRVGLWVFCKFDDPHRLPIRWACHRVDTWGYLVDRYGMYWLGAAAVVGLVAAIGTGRLTSEDAR